MTPRPVAERFWEKVDRAAGVDGCWPWTATRTPQNYGQFDKRGSHRVAFELTNGAIPAGLYVLHSCDNPPCCNPAHLSLGTHADNLREAAERGLFPLKIPDQDVVVLRTRVAAGESVASAARGLRIEYSTAKKMVRGWLRPHVGGPLTRPRVRPTKAASVGVGR